MIPTLYIDKLLEFESNFVISEKHVQLYNNFILIAKLETDEDRNVPPCS